MQVSKTFATPDRARLYPENRPLGWRAQKKVDAEYHSPEEWYQSIVESLVDANTAWIDIGGGQFLFPDNQALAAQLAQRCKLLVGVDPSDNIQHNAFVHERAQVMLEDFQTHETFDLATLRMVAEHVEHPDQFLGKLATILLPGGYVVLVTPFKWSIASILAALIPAGLHGNFVRLLFPSREDKHIFPTFYKLNTRSDLKRWFESLGFAEVTFLRIPDCSLLQRFRMGTRLELFLFRICRALRITYPETNIVAVFRKSVTVIESTFGNGS